MDATPSLLDVWQDTTVRGVQFTWDSTSFILLQLFKPVVTQCSVLYHDIKAKLRVDGVGFVVLKFADALSHCGCRGDWFSAKIAEKTNGKEKKPHPLPLLFCSFFFSFR